MKWNWVKWERGDRVTPWFNREVNAQYILEINQITGQEAMILLFDGYYPDILLYSCQNVSASSVDTYIPYKHTNTYTKESINPEVNFN